MFLPLTDARVFKFYKVARAALMHDSSCSVADPDQFYAIFDYFKWISCSGLWPDTGRYLVVTTCRKMLTQDPRKKYFDISRIQI